MAVPNTKRSNPFIGDLEQFQAPEFSGAREAARGLVADIGGADTRRNAGSVMNQFQRIGGAMGGQDMEMFMRTTQGLAKGSGMTYNELLQMGAVGGNVGGQMGFDRRIGMATALQSAGFGQAFQQAGGGGSNMTAAQARQLDQELRLSAANSPMANMLGAAMAMSETGLLKGKSVNMGGQNVNLAALSGNDPTKRQETLTQLARLNPSQFVDMMKQAGVNPDTASQFLGSQQANKDQIARHGIQDIVRTQQQSEVRDMMTEQMSGSLISGLKQAGVRNPNQRRAMSMAAGEAIQNAMSAMAADPNSKNMTPEERNKRLTTAAQQALPGVDAGAVAQMTAGAVRSMEERVRADPNLQKFGDLKGLMAMNRADIVGGGMANAARAEAVARKDMGRQFDAEQKEVQRQENDMADADKNRDRAEGMARKPQGADGVNQNTQPIKITGTLTIAADGSALIDAEGGAPANP